MKLKDLFESDLESVAKEHNLQLSGKRKLKVASSEEENKVHKSLTKKLGYEWSDNLKEYNKKVGKGYHIVKPNQGKDGTTYTHRTVGV